MNAKLGVSSISTLILVAMLAACGGGGGGPAAGSSGDGSTTGTGAGGTTAATGGGSTTAGSSGTSTTIDSTGQGTPVSDSGTSSVGDGSSIVARVADPAPPPPATPSGTVEFAATFPDFGQFTNSSGDGMSNDGVWWVEEKTWGRASVVWGGRDDNTALRLHTEPGDNSVSGSGVAERNDVALRTSSGAYQGEEQWWAHSIMLPDDFADLPAYDGGQWNWGSLMNFHNDAGGDTRGPAQLVYLPTGIRYQIYGGDPANPVLRDYPVAPIMRGVWYDFVIHVRWSWDNDGFYEVWLNGKRVFQDWGPNLYWGHGAYMKLANYHSPFGRATSVIHDRVIRGTTWQVVALTGLEGISW